MGVLKEYSEYVGSTSTDVKFEEARYLDNVNVLDKKIQDLYKQVNALKQQKIDLETKLSKNCLEYISKKHTYHNKLKNLEIQNISSKKSQNKSKKFKNNTKQ